MTKAKVQIPIKLSLYKRERFTKVQERGDTATTKRTYGKYETRTPQIQKLTPFQSCEDEVQVDDGKEDETPQKPLLHHRVSLAELLSCPFHTDMYYCCEITCQHHPFESL